MALFRLNIEWADSSKNTLVYKYPFKKGGREVNDKSRIVVRESQCAVFVHKGQIADVFGPGTYEMKTATLPILSKLVNWKYGFENSIVCDVYFINTKQFTDIKWGTKNPIIMRDSEFGNVRVRGFGAFSFKVDDPTVFLKELFGTNSTFVTEDIAEYLKTLLISSLTDAVGESKISVLDLAGNTEEFNVIVKSKVQNKFNGIGLKLVTLVIENMSVPEEIEKALDERSKLGILGDKTDVLMKVAAAEAMKEAAKNPGNPMAGAGVGIGAGVGMGQIFAEAFKSTTNSQPQSTQTQGKKACPSCGAMINKNAKFCSECGEKLQTKSFCPECGAEINGKSKFCPECGTKL
ncbi:MAG: SPFH domain-containing protein [Clostridia bacterium]|nr:SPFH domain-containing protein [Clostridia bacterium]